MEGHVHHRYSITLVGDLYLSVYRGDARLSLAVAGPFDAVKEQSAGLYAHTMTERGFVTLAFDLSFVGERHSVASPDIKH